MPTLRDLVISVANTPDAANQAALCRLLPGATVFIKLVGAPEVGGHGEKYVVRDGSGTQIRCVRLPSGIELVRASASPPLAVAPDEAVATMTGHELLRMVLKTPARGVLITAEDKRDSWTAIMRDRIESILKEAP